MTIIEQLARELNRPAEHIENVVRLLDEGNTIPFIARYRKELHGSMDDTALRTLEERLAYLRNLTERKESVKASIAEQEKLTDELAAAIDAAQTLAEVEDLYRPYKPKRRTRATVAKEKGLEPLAALLFAQERDCPRPEEAAADYLSAEKGVETVADALQGANDIVAEWISDDAAIRRSLRELLEKEMGVEEANKRIYATTDRAKGTLKQLADAQGWPTFVVPDDVGGRYSVLSAVGLLPIAAAGIDIDALMQGAADAMERFSVLSPDNDAYKYAAIRNILYRKGKAVEILECYEPDFTLMNEWYKQLFGESEGKDNKGLFPASCIFSTDLHSMGQFIQEGARIMFETIVDVKKPAQDLFIDPLEGNFDGLNFLANQNMSVVNRKAMEGTILAHTDGGVPEVLIEVDDLSAYNVGYLIYFFWRACACSGYLLSVNPFNQPGVESYKKNMFALLGKPGYEGLTAELEAKLK